MHLDIEPSELASCWFLTGPTASGKTSVGLELAQRLNAEIISLDSMAVYRGMNIGTAKPTPQQQAQVPHHLIDIRDPDEHFSVSEYLQEAIRTIREIQTRDRQVLFVQCGKGQKDQAVSDPKDDRIHKCAAGACDPELHETDSGRICRWRHHALSMELFTIFNE